MLHFNISLSTDIQIVRMLLFLNRYCAFYAENKALAVLTVKIAYVFAMILWHNVKEEIYVIEIKEFLDP